MTPLMMKRNIKDEIVKAITKINETNPYYLVIGVLAVALVLDYLLIMQFQLGALRKLGPKVSQIKSEIELFETNKGRMDKYQQEIVLLDQKLAGLQGRIKKTADISSVLEDLSLLANTHKIFVKETIPNTDLEEPVLENEEGKYYLLPVMIDARGSYHSFGHFLNDLEEKGTLMRVDQMKISASEDNPRQHVVKLVIQAVLFEPAEKGVQK